MVEKVPGALFGSTIYFYDHQAEMPQCTGLSTFRNHDADAIVQLQSRVPFFTVWKHVSYAECLFVYGVILIVLTCRGWRADKWLAAFSSLGLTLTGLGIVFVTALITTLIPRYAAPMWELLIVAIMICISQLFHPAREGRRAASSLRTEM